MILLCRVGGYYASPDATSDAVLGGADGSGAARMQAPLWRWTNHLRGGSILARNRSSRQRVRLPLWCA
ncbi:MAG: hypothetical protein ACPH5G_18550, partial [Pseudooceanicola atlanticus]